MYEKPVVHGFDHRPGGIDPNKPGRKHLIGAAGEPAFQNSWANIGGSNVPMQFLIVIGRPNDLNLARDAIVRYHHKVLEIAGDITGGDNATTVFTLPLEYRFEEDRPFPAHDSVGAYVACRLYANGDFVRGTP